MSTLVSANLLQFIRVEVAHIRPRIVGSAVFADAPSLLARCVLQKFLHLYGLSFHFDASGRKSRRWRRFRLSRTFLLSGGQARGRGWPSKHELPRNRSLEPRRLVKPLPEKRRLKIAKRWKQGYASFVFACSVSVRPCIEATGIGSHYRKRGCLCSQSGNDEGMLKFGIEQCVNQSWDMLEELLGDLAAES